MATIIIADDELISRQTLAAIVESEGHRILHAANGSEVLDLAGKEAVDVIMTDIFMPEKEGLQTIKELQQKHPGIKLIAFSGGSTFSSYEPLRWADDLGVLATLKKPFQRQEVLDALARAIAP